MKSKLRAIRRHHYDRLKKKRIRDHYWGRGFVDGVSGDWTEACLGIATETPKNCSCWICTENRKNHGKPIQELRQLDSANDQF